jgi:hypothetical protein
MAYPDTPIIGIEALDRLVGIKEEIQGLLIEANMILLRTDRPICNAAESWMNKIEGALWGNESPSMATTIDQLTNGR